MQAVVLVGGQGTRLRPLTDTRPKPMMALVDRPFVAHQIDLLRRHGIDDVIFSCGYRPDALRAHFGDRSPEGVRFRYVVDPVPLGTAGAVKNAQDLLGDEAFLVFNGDILTDLDLDAFARRHHENGAVGTIALTPVDDPSAFGLVRLFEGGAVEAFVEKPRPDELRPGEPFRINAGTYLLEPRVLDDIPVGVSCSIEREVFPALAGQGRLFGFPSDAYWRDIGTPASYLSAVHDVLTGALHTESPTGGAYLGPGARVDDSARVDARSSIGAGASVGAGATVSESVIGAGALIGEGAVIQGAIVGEGVSLAAGVRLPAGSIIGDRATISAGARVDPGEPVATGAAL